MIDLSTWPAPRDGWPAALWDVPYVGAAIPGATAPPSWLDGSNCQRFAYGVLSLFGIDCPPFRSSELWEDLEATVTVTGDPQPLDLVLFNPTPDPWGAHFGLWMAPDQILHLNREMGRPAVWPLATFLARPRYATVIGFKRVKA